MPDLNLTTSRRSLIFRLYTKNSNILSLKYFEPKSGPSVIAPISSKPSFLTSVELIPHLFPDDRERTILGKYQYETKIILGIEYDFYNK